MLEPFRSTGHCASFGAAAEVVRLARGDGSGGAWQGLGGPDEGPGQREQGQGDELRPDGQGGATRLEAEQRAADDARGVVVPVFRTSGRLKHQAALRLNFSPSPVWPWSLLLACCSPVTRCNVYFP